ncbi:hypothetical protein TrCOL_g11624 [Triparma columacea]|uniref:asparaginase n=1 Tax=Triparma columacea TaxID=722753 RepID=A0A9W7LFN5_9STRA|nr:hypothetical protein TrCOL_g11624 [Triparma columacea]
MSRTPPRDASSPVSKRSKSSHPPSPPPAPPVGSLSAFSSHQSIASLASHASASNSITLVNSPFYGDDGFIDASLTASSSNPAPPSVPSVSAHQGGDQDRGKVLILYTGGTMGMKKQADGGLAPERGYLTQKIMEMEEIRNDSMPLCYIKEYKELIDSSAMGHSEWCMIARDISENYYKFDGFVVIMGTDTMAYAATALSFMLENLNKTVVFTGSQIPFAEVYNDARRNLIASIIFASNQDFCEVCLFFNASLLRGNRSVKQNAFGLDAFSSPNFPPLATLGVNTVTRKDIALPPPTAPFRLFTDFETGVVTVKLIPKFDDEPLLMMVKHSSKLRAVIFEMYGTGNAPGCKRGLMDVLSTCRTRGILVVVATQCSKGSVVMGKYSVGKALEGMGGVSAGDMTAEATAVKVAYLMRKVGTMEEVKRLLEVNLRGELSDLESHKKKTSDPLTFEHLFPFYLIVTFFGLFVMFAGLRCMMDGSDDIITHNLDGSLNGFSWFWGFLCGFCRINPACAVMVSTCLVSLSLWSKHRAMSVKSGLSYLAFPDQGCRSPPPKGLHDVSQSAILKSQSMASLIAIPSGAASSSMTKALAQTSSSDNLLAHDNNLLAHDNLLAHSKSGGSTSVFPLSPLPSSPPDHIPKTKPIDPYHRWYHSLTKVTFLIALSNTLLVLLFGMTCSIFPGWIWHFSAVFFYNVPKMKSVDRAIVGVCPSYGGDMCLSNDAWLLLSNGLLSKYKRADVESVARGVNVAQNGGLIINVMARDIAPGIPALISNVDALAPFYGGKLSVVIYENDSVDGTRDMIKEWRGRKNNYAVDLITCEDEGDEDCRLQETHRYDQHGDKMSAIGKMADYRNKVMDYISKNYNPKEYTHMMVADVDLAISWAPLGLLHTLGTVGEHSPVAVRGIMMIPGALGSLYSPYDYSAFRPYINEDNEGLRNLHDWFCELAPPGSRWRNNCDVMSPFNMMHMLSLDTEFVSEPYPIASGFNGATIYPYSQILATHPRYDDGDDGQRCEHIGFNYHLTDSDNWEEAPENAKFAEKMYVNPKWTIHLDPRRPGGPTGWRFASLIATQGVNVQCGIMFTSVCLCNWMLAGAVAAAITGMVRAWEKLIKTPAFRKLAVAAGVNLAEFVPGGLGGGQFRKNTADEGVLEMMAIAAREGLAREGDSDDEEAGFLSKVTRVNKNH